MIFSSGLGRSFRRFLVSTVPRFAKIFTQIPQIGQIVILETHSPRQGPLTTLAFCREFGPRAVATLQDFPRHHERKKGAPVGVLWSFAKRDLYEKQRKKLLVYWNCNCRLNGLIFTRNTTLFSKDKPGLEGTCEMVLQLLSLYPASIFGYRQQRQDLCKLISSSMGVPGR